MSNPLDLEKDDADFVKAMQDSHERDLKIAKLTISRNWMLVAFLLQSFLMLAALLFAPHQVFSQLPLAMVTLVLNVGQLSHLDIQVKMLKAARTA